MPTRYFWGALALVLGLLAAPACRRPDPPPPPGRFVHRVGRDIVDPAGRPLSLRGLNVGQWLFWEHWLMGAPIGPAVGTAGETALVANLESVVGADRTARFAGELRDAFFTEADMVAIAALGFNVVRVPFHGRLVEEQPAEAWRRLDDLMDWSERTGVYVVLDLHGAPCGQNSLFTSDPGPVLLWDSPSCQDRTVAIWRAVAARYASRPTLAAWDLLNEPSTPRRPADLPALYRRIIAAVRSVDPDHLIMLEGGRYGTDFSMFTGVLDPNTAYSFHQYLWGTRDPAGDIARTEAVAARHGLPLWMGEFGQDTVADVALQADRFNSHPAITGWAAWSWKGSPGVRGAREVRHVEPGATWDRVIRWMTNPDESPRPTAAEAETGMREYLAAVRLDATTPEQAVIEALGPLSGPVHSGVDTAACATVGTDDATVELRPCGGTTPSWTRTIAALTPLRTLGRCVGVPGADSFAIRLGGCDGDRYWTVERTDGTVRGGGRCLTDPSGRAAAGTALRLEACDGRAGQRWSVT